MSNNMHNTQAGQLQGKKIWYVLALLVCIVLFFLVTYSLIRYFIDLNNYKKGHQAYLQSNCTLAITHYTNILNGNRLIDLGNFSVLAQQEGRECQNYLNAAQKQAAQNYDEALLAFMGFINDFRESQLTGFVRNRIASLFEVTTPAELATQDTCSKINFLIDENLVPQPELNLSLFYMACGNLYDAVNMQQEAYDMYEIFLTEYPDNPFAQTVETHLMSNPIACENISPLKMNKVISNRVDFLPGLYQSCAQIYTTNNKSQAAFDLYVTLLSEYPQHTFATNAENALLSSSTGCENIVPLKNNEVISAREDFLPNLYYNCGQLYEGQENWADAISVYETFLAEHSGHSLSAEVEAALARSIVAQASKSSAGEIPAPEPSSNTGSSATQVNIQNDSPDRIRIVFSGPEAHIEELDACGSCSTYYGIGPLACPDLGPSGTYTLQPGEYDIVVESISDEGVTPYTGTWVLESGSLYDNCFFIVSKLTQ